MRIGPPPPPLGRLLRIVVGMMMILPAAAHAQSAADSNFDAKTAAPPVASVVFRPSDPFPTVEIPMRLTTSMERVAPRSPFPGAERYAVVGGVAGLLGGAAVRYARCDSPDTATCVGQAAMHGAVWGALGYLAGYVVGAAVVSVR